ncbi:substrate-binding periplasmic protein [Desulforegula conservatrix]|uniref:substrate-binding periplasmic protein n=1 Tax=Desulforegula conservatrix TaxID=153026 RepID=UPI00041B70C9|nr:transporter substrate-binding domain-containing protein [Desulforegula conservatrix]
MPRSFSMAIVLISIFPALIFGQESSPDFQKIRWMTEEYAPYNYTERGILKGISVDILNEIWKRSGIGPKKPDIEVLPWARGYMYLKNEKNSCLFSMGITEERKKHFIFSNPILSNNNVIIAKKSKKYKIDSINELKNIIIGTVREDAGEQFLVSAGCQMDKLERSSSAETLVRKLAMGRMDAISYGEDTAAYNMKLYGIDPNQYEVIYLINKSETAFGFNKDTEPEIIARFNKTIDDLKKDGTIERIREKYLR